MNRLTNAEMADMHLAYGNARHAAMLHQERVPNRYVPSHRMFSNVHQRLYVTTAGVR